jgi:hypothetical protein
MANITSTEAATAIATIIAAQALGHLKANTVLAMLVARDWDNEVATHGQVVKIQQRGALSVNDKSANTVVTLQTPSTTAYTVTLNKHKEVSFLLEDFARVLARPDLIGGYMEDGVKVLAEEIDEDLAALYSGFSQTINATTGLVEATFREGRRLLNAAKAPLSNRFAVLHEDAEKEFLGIEKVGNKDYERISSLPDLKSAYGGVFYGFDVFMDQKIAVATAQCKNLFFHRNAMVLATRPLPNDGGQGGVIQTTMSEDGIGLRVTMSYNPDHLGWQVTIDVLYGVAELRDNHGITVSTTEA